jgi:hypothetical protein
MIPHVDSTIAIAADQVHGVADFYSADCRDIDKR